MRAHRPANQVRSLEHTCLVAYRSFTHATGTDAKTEDHFRHHSVHDSNSICGGRSGTCREITLRERQFGPDHGTSTATMRRRAFQNFNRPAPRTAKSLRPKLGCPPPPFGGMGAKRISSSRSAEMLDGRIGGRTENTMRCFRL